MSRADARAREALWEAMVDRVETAHDLVVRSQRRGALRSAREIRQIALDLAALAHAASLFAKIPQ